MTSDTRDMCAELLRSLENYPVQPSRDRDLCVRARALLAQSDPEGPTDEELTLTYAYAVAAAVDNKRGQFTTEDIEAAQLAGLRAVLAKWGCQ